MATEHTSLIGELAAGKLLKMATGERWIPAILILAGIILFRKRIAARASRRPDRIGIDRSL